MRSIKFYLTVFACIASIIAVSQNPFTSGSVVILRIGDGSVALSTSAHPVFLEEYSSTGLLIQSIMMPTALNGSNHIFTLTGTNVAIGGLTQSPNGQFISAIGFDASVGTGSTDLGTANKTIGIVNSNAIINTNSSLSDIAGTTAISSITNNGTSIWMTTSIGLSYATVGSSTSTSILANTGLRIVGIGNNQLVSTNSVGRVLAIGTGLPTTGPQTSTNFPGIPVATNAGTSQCLFVDLNPLIPGDDVIYTAHDGTLALKKYSFNGSTWVDNGTIGDTNDDYRGITGIVSGTTVTLFILRKATTAGGGELVTLTDASGHNGTFTGTPVVLATASSQTSFRGIAIAPRSDYYRSKQAGDWSDINTWETSSDKTSWSNATLAPNSSSKGVAIANAVTVNSAIIAGTVQIDPGGSLTINSTLQVNTSLQADGNINIAGGGLLRMAFGSTITGTSSSNYIVTNTSGSSVGKVEFTNIPASAKTFPIGTATHYMPVTITPDNAGATFSVGVFEGATENGAPNGTSFSSPILKNIVNATWQIDRSVTSTSATVGFTWDNVQEGTGFSGLSNSQVGIIHHNGTGYDLPTGTADNTTNTATANFSSFSPFVVGTTTPKVALKIFLQGAYNGTISRHKDVNAAWTSILNTHALSQPYSGAPFNYAGTESVAPGFFVTPTAATTDITDWILLDLRDETTPATVIKQRAAFIREDGAIVDLDGISPVVFAGVAPGNYYLNIRHRNHLGVRTSVVIATDGTLSSTPTLYDATSAQTQAFQNVSVTTNAAMKELTTTTVFGMWGGNVNANNNVRYTGLNNDPGIILSVLGTNQAAILSGVYNAADVNMDGLVRYTGLNNDSGVILSVLGTNQAAIFTQH